MVKGMVFRIFSVCFFISRCWVFAIARDSSFPINNEKLVSDTKQEYNRDGKIFSLFSIVQFKNEACRSSQSLVGDTVPRNGTCYSSTECSDKSGVAAGGCAAGFGVCCVFVYEASGSIITQNCSYIRNPNYPNALTATDALSFTIQKCDASVCHLRLDFESFDTNGLSGSGENNAGLTDTTLFACQDQFTIASPADPGLPTICGQNTGQHVYVDMGTLASDTTTLNFAFSGTYSRLYEIKVTQLPCSSEYNRFPGCFQYHEGLTGRVESFNFPNCGAQSHLPYQDYSVCVRPEAGYDCIQWQICPGTTCGAGVQAGGVTNGVVGDKSGESPCTAFSVGSGVAAGTEKTPANSGLLCSQDYIRINGGTTPCCQNTGPYPDLFCGAWLTIDLETGSNTPICDCQAPFQLEVYFDNMADIAGTANVLTSCGICLEYNQVRC